MGIRISRDRSAIIIIVMRRRDNGLLIGLAFKKSAFLPDPFCAPSPTSINGRFSERNFLLVRQSFIYGRRKHVLKLHKERNS